MTLRGWLSAALVCVLTAVAVASAAGATAASSTAENIPSAAQGSAALPVLDDEALHALVGGATKWICKVQGPCIVGGCRKIDSTYWYIFAVEYNYYCATAPSGYDNCYVFLCKPCCLKKNCNGDPDCSPIDDCGNPVDCTTQYRACILWNNPPPPPFECAESAGSSE